VHSTHSPDELQRSRGGVVQWPAFKHSTHSPALQNGVGAWQLFVCSHASVFSLQPSLVQDEPSSQLFGTQLQLPLGPGLKQKSTVQNSPSLHCPFDVQGAVGHV